MAITFVGAGTSVVDDTTIQTTGTTLTPNASTLTDDFMLAVIGRDDNLGTWDDPPETGWTLIGQISETTGRNFRLMLAYKIATSGSEPAATFTGDSVTAGVENSGAILTFRGIDTSNPLDVTFVEVDHTQKINNADNPSTHTYNPITTVTNGSFVIVAEHLAATKVVTSGVPTGYSTALAINDNLTGNEHVWYKSVSAGTDSPSAAGHILDSTVGDGGSFTIAIRPDVLSPGYISSTTQFHDPSFIIDQFVNNDFLGSTASLYTPDVKLDQTLSATYISTGNSLHEPFVFKEGTLPINFISSEISLHEPAVHTSEPASSYFNQAWFKDPTGLSTTWFGVNRVISPTPISSGSNLHEPGVNPGAVTLSVDYLTPGPDTIHEPLLNISDTISVDFLQNQHSLFRPVLGQVFNQILGVNYKSSSVSLYEPNTVNGGSIDGQDLLTISTNYQSKTLYRNPLGGWYTID